MSRRAAPILFGALLVSLQIAPGRAEVWPVPSRALCAGPFATLEPGAFGLWSNPALAALGPTASVG